MRVHYRRLEVWDAGRAGSRFRSEAVVRSGITPEIRAAISARLFGWANCLFLFIPPKLSCLCGKQGSRCVSNVLKSICGVKGIYPIPQANTI